MQGRFLACPGKVNAGREPPVDLDFEPGDMRTLSLGMQNPPELRSRASPDSMSTTPEVGLLEHAWVWAGL